MEKITLSNNICAEVELRLMRDSSSITLKLTPKYFNISNIKYLANLIIKKTIVNIILEDGCVYEDEALYECREKIDFDFFNYNDFLILFREIKKIAEKETLVKNYFNNRALIKLNQIFWPNNKKDQLEALDDLCNFEIFFKKKYPNLSLKKFSR
ncbi:MAG: hypothetical protein PF572_00480 [Patescibacteria group bacterium]|jgi:hypothetical protein|nr:hypothetical protein [Patescibacteria group bacterium]